jgi:hypothetical protein
MRVRATALGLLVSAAGVLAAAQLAAQTAAPEQPSTAEQAETIDEVVVRGRRMSEIEADLRIVVRDFVGEVVATPPGRGYARWHRRVCIGVHNLETTAAQYVVDRISQLALEVGLTPGEPGCTPDVVIIFATDAERVASYIVENWPRLFRPSAAAGGMTLSRATLDEFAESDRAVRWWHVSMPVDARTGERAIRLPGDAPPQVAVAGPSRIHEGTRDDLQNVFIIVDGTKLTGTTWQQLADYLAVVSLAQVDPDANPVAFDSILNLFTNPGAYSGLTDWDRSYVRALYKFDQERRPQAQTGDLVSEMARRELDPRLQ